MLSLFTLISMKTYLHALTVVFAILICEQSNAYSSGNFWGGLGYYSENALNETANDATGKTGLFGTTNYPFIFKYDYEMTSGWFVAPQLNYTLLPRKTKGDGAEVTINHIVFNFGRNSGNYDWSFGPGILRETIKGKGGTTVLNNGNSTSTFANPGRSVTTQNITLDLGAGIESGKFRYGLDLYFVAPFSSKERTQNLMFSVIYNFTGSSSGRGNGGSGGMFKW